MSPVAVSTPTSPKLAAAIPRRPSPWHKLAHSLSSTPLPSIKTCRSSSASIVQPLDDPDQTTSSPPLSSSQALREWEARLSHPDAPVTRHHLSPRPTSAPKLAAEKDKEGHIEYKLKLIDPTPERFERLVTQMMWRLMQGRNEAIYEIGLAGSCCFSFSGVVLTRIDDGTVIGLTRTEMDASLRTLELMASELGATVLVLKEIVLAGSTISRSTSVSSSAISISSNPSPSPTKGWQMRRPDPEHGKSGSGELKGRRVRRRDLWTSGGRVENNKEKQVIFDPADLEAADTGSDDSSSRRLSSTTDEDVPPFQLDLEDSVPSPSTPSVSFDRWRRIPRAPPQMSEADRAGKERKAEMKRVKSVARREERRLDLLRGDGKSPLFILGSSVHDTPPIPALPHKLARPSSLRLATPASLDDGLISDLLHVPLDSLSLSFAEVRTVTCDDEPSPSTSADTVYAIPQTEEDMICVEALVVRKGGFGGEDEGWGFGGEEDGWGFGGTDEVEELDGVEDTDDVWGLDWGDD
jgi:hypothetical protein